MKVGGNDNVILASDNIDDDRDNDNGNNKNKDNDFVPHNVVVAPANMIMTNDNNENEFFPYNIVVAATARMRRSLFLVYKSFSQYNGGFCTNRGDQICTNRRDQRIENRGRKNKFSQRGSCSVLPERCVSL